MTTKPPLPNIYIKSLDFDMKNVWDYIDNLICTDLDMKFTAVSQTLKDGEGYQYNNFLFVMKADDIQLIKSIVEQPCLIAKYRYIILKIVEQMKHYTITALSSLIKKYSSHNVFIIIENQYNPVPTALQGILQRVLVAKGKEQRELIFVSTFFKTSLDNLLSLYKRQAPTYFSELRKFCVKISAGCIPISKLSQYVLEWNADQEIVFFLANLDMDLKKTNKGLFALEYFFQNIIHHIKMKNDL